MDKTEVLKIINNFKDKTAAGFHKISVKLSKHIAPYIVDTLIYNILNVLCIIVKPPYKTGNKENVSNC